MKNKKNNCDFISYVAQIIIGSLGIICFIIIALSSSREEVAKYLLAVLVAVVMIIVGIIGIRDYKKKRK